MEFFQMRDSEFAIFRNDKHMNKTCLINGDVGYAVISKTCHYCDRKLSDRDGDQFFLVPHKVLDGGVIGIALIANYVFDLHIGFVIILCSIPMFIAAWMLNREIFYNSLSGMLISSFVIDLLSPLQTDFLRFFAPPCDYQRAHRRCVDRSRARIDAEE